MLRLKFNLRRAGIFMAVAAVVCTFLPLPAVKAEETASANPYYTFNANMKSGLEQENLSENNEGIPIIVPDITINFKLTAGDAVAATDSNQIPLKRGVMDGVDSNYSASFKMSDYSQDELNALRTSKTRKWSDISSRVNTSDKTYSQKVKIDFSKVKFTDPGVYHYVITVQDQEKPSVVFDIGDDDPYIDIFVYVLQKDDGSLFPEATASGIYEAQYYGKILSCPNKDGTGVYNGTSGKTRNFNFYYGGRNIIVDKGVSGNMGDRSEYFNYTAHFEGLDKNMIYRIDTSSASGPAGSPNNEYFISDSEGKADVSVKLKHGDKIAFAYIPRLATYKISEDSGNGYDVLLGHETSKMAKDAINDIKNYDNEFLKGYGEYVYSTDYNGAPNVKKIKIGEKSVEKTMYATIDGVYQPYETSVSEPVYMVGSYNDDNSITGTAIDSGGIKETDNRLLTSKCDYILYESGGKFGPWADSLHYINVRNGILPTGVILNNLPAIFGILSIAIMAVIIVLTRKKPAKKEKQ